MLASCAIILLSQNDAPTVEPCVSDGFFKDTPYATCLDSLEYCDPSKAHRFCSACMCRTCAWCQGVVVRNITSAREIARTAVAEPPPPPAPPPLTHVQTVVSACEPVRPKDSNVHECDRTACAEIILRPATLAKGRVNWLCGMCMCYWGTHHAGFGTERPPHPNAGFGSRPGCAIRARLL